MSARTPAQRGTATVLALWLTVFGCMAVWIGAQRSIDRVRNTWPEAYPLLLLPNGQYLRAASLGFNILLADWIYLWSIQYYGHARTPEGRRYLEHIYNTITDLDPQFIDAYTTGALVMASDMADPGLAVQLLERGIERNPDNWVLPWDAGWWSWMHLNDYERAEQYFAHAMDLPGAPAWIARLRAHLRSQRGDLASAIIFWEEILAEAEAEGDETSAAIARQRIPDLYSEYAIGEITRAIGAFEERQGRRPENLALLVRLDLLDSVFTDDEGRPVNYQDEPFIYDPRTGEVTDPAAEQARTSR